MMMSPSSAPLANRSFLYGGAGGGGGVTGGGDSRHQLHHHHHDSSSSSTTSSSTSSLASERIVYATLDSLALRRATLPLRLVPIDVEEPISTREQRRGTVATPPPIKPKPAVSSKTNLQKDTRSLSTPEAHRDGVGVVAKPTTLAIEAIVLRPVLARDVENGSTRVETQALDSDGNNDSAYNGYSSCASLAEPNVKKPTSKKKPKKDKTGAGEESKKERREFTFAKNVLHYVPMTSRRYYRKSRKLASKSLSLKSLGSAPADGLKSRSLSRDELKYVTISMPSNFVHVASATRSDLGYSLAEQESGRHITHEGKYADLRGGQYAEVAQAEESNKGSVINDSFLWRTLPRVKSGAEVTVQRNEEEDYDDVGPPVNSTPNANLVEKCETSDNNSSSSTVNNSHCSNDGRSESKVITEQPEHVEDEYDDVGPGCTVESTCPGDETPASTGYDDQVYDDVMPLRTVDYDSPAPPTEPEESEVELRRDAVDEDVYDDVGLPSIQPATAECHERVNSLYAGSSTSDSIHLAYHCYDKESEWEDLDDAALYGSKVGSEQQWQPGGGGSSPSKKKLVCQRWSRKVRRQRSKASRKSSGRSTSRSRTRPHATPTSATASAASTTAAEMTTTTTTTSDARDNRAYSVAVSLGAGTVLLLGRQPLVEEWIGKTQLEEQQTTTSSTGNDEAKGLVQLRLLLEDDVQEASLYIAEDSSDDSNYETLETYEPDDFSSDSECGEESSPTTPGLQLSIQEPPSRPIPPPPREASLGHTLGRRMKMLRRTWSITKGSLGRMRRRASGEPEPPDTCLSAANNSTSSGSSAEARKYFSFKKHFRKSQATGLSTFYLDRVAVAGDDEGKGLNGTEGQRDQEPIYTNGNWYQEAGLYGSEHSGKQDVVAVDHYSVLAEEPLYQFYAAAATRVAFESDSDGYEEVEELTPSSATTDLAKPGHRTLWCQTPQVINSGLLQHLSMEERKIQEAKFEILTSEASYLNSLRVLENEFASNQELVQDILTSAEREKLFGAVPDVLVASERFLAELETIWREDPMLARLPELLLKHGERSAAVYVDYCSNQVSIDTTLKELRAKKGYKFLETVSRIEMHPACQSLSLHSFLMLPMQRITRLPLLADAVLSKLSVEHSERLNWERVLAALSHIVGKCNEGARLAERRNEMEALARKLEYSAKVSPIALRDRELIRSGTVIQLSTKSDTEYKLTFGKKFHKTPLMLMLLTDYLLVTKLKSNSNDETYNVIESCKRSLVALESAPEDSPFAGRHAMVLTLLENHAGRQVEYVLTCDNDTEKERWLDAVSPPKPTCVGETLYESWDCPQVMALYSYAPRQPDELALQPGDVINVLRKMNDGWLFGEKLLDGEQGWFPGNFTKEVASEHVRARNLRQRHRFLALSGSVLQRRAKQSLSLL